MNNESRIWPVATDPSKEPHVPVQAQYVSPYADGKSVVDSKSFEGPIYSSVLSFGSWLLIAVVVLGISGLVSYSQYIMPRSMESSSAELLAPNITAKMFAGFKTPETEALAQIEPFKTGPLEQRYCHAILIQEISGPGKANEVLENIDQAVELEVAARNQRNEESQFPTESQNSIRRTLGKLFVQYEAGDFDSATISDDEQQLLMDKLGWIANLALTPKDSPNESKRKEIKDTGKRMVIIVMVAAVLGFLAILGALFATFMLIILYASKQIKIQFQNSTGYGFVYLETFAIWILLFFGLQIGLGKVATMLGRDDLTLVLSPIAFFGSLFVLAWPLFRGIPFSTMCRDIGWEIRNPFAEVFVGGFSYLALLLPMLAGLIVSVLIGSGLAMLVSTGEFESAGPVGHPIAEEIANGGPMVWILVVVSACIAAPIVEETMFRGVLYRYLRDVTSKNKSRWLSVTASSIIGGLIFAMIHPQGLIGIPILTTLAIGFSLVREWRNSLIAPMVMHAINNGIVTCLLLTMMS